MIVEDKCKPVSVLTGAIAWHQSCIIPFAGNRRRRFTETPMQAPTHELMFALRSQSSGWLAAIVCTLEEALRDPTFNEHHRDLVQRLLNADSVPANVASAAQERLCRFEQSISESIESRSESIAESIETAASLPVRPKLTLVGNAA